jgi:hypothetical protein
MSEYNGWSNYATWRVNLELFNDYNVWDKHLMDDVYELSHHLRDTAEVYIEDTSTEGLARDYAMAFLDEVNWEEIARNMLSDVEEEGETK